MRRDYTEKEIKEMPSIEITMYIRNLRLDPHLNYKKAKEIALPFIAELELRAVAIAKKFNRKPQKFNFARF